MLTTRGLGRRGAFLLLVGIMWATYGYGLIHSPLGDQRGLTLLIRLCPLPRWGYVWLIAGTIAVIAALSTRRRWDEVGYVAVLIPPMLWGLAYLTAWWPLGVYPRGWATAAVWGMVTTAVMIVAGWPEPPSRWRRRR